MVVMAVLIVLGSSSGQVLGLASYDDAVRCAGLTQAASELEGGETARGRLLFDAALYWSLAAGQAADAAGRAPQISDNDQTRARIRAVHELSRGDAGASEGLTHCLDRTPDLG